eukprot:CAMPEP_0115528970 /NCGR_PEP_ID=MMETSP0271-20121206/83678_1 /TAXON_ID=71861 /ORGANISM="Scrippsiella trochoidea, Strain CCMP3099" /LENGTH=117 /DNA_ID=CAMNT_0002960933 /DNA_START=275 /DNA_END=625 /DNA_ORIENTATION=-
MFAQLLCGMLDKRGIAGSTRDAILKLDVVRATGEAGRSRWTREWLIVRCLDARAALAPCTPVAGRASWTLHMVADTASGLRNTIATLRIRIALPLANTIAPNLPMTCWAFGTRQCIV